MRLETKETLKMNTKNKVKLNLSDIKAKKSVAKLNVDQKGAISGGKAQYDAFAQLN